MGEERPVHELVEHLFRHQAGQILAIFCNIRRWEHLERSRFDVMTKRVPDSVAQARPGFRRLMSLPSASRIPSPGFRRRFPSQSRSLRSSQWPNEVADGCVRDRSPAASIVGVRLTG